MKKCFALLVALAMVTTSLTLCSCGKKPEGPLEKAGAKADAMVDKANASVNDAANKTADAMDEAADKIREE